ncbi:hypothetical protein KJ680_14260 [bacterium]|nr:hypothetical protein [bacterium]
MENLIKSKSNFGLKNYQAVSERYQGKWNKYNEVIEDFDADNFEAYLEHKVYNDHYRMDMYRKMLDEAKTSGKKLKSTLNMVKTWINDTALRANAELFTDANTTKHNYATKLYLKHYRAINEAMHEVFLGFTL